MAANVGKIDRLLRFILGFVLVVLPLMNFPELWSNEWLAYASMGIGAVLALTAVISFCPIYRLFGMSTCKL